MSEDLYVAAGAVIAAVIAALAQGRSNRNLRLLELRAKAYGDCVEALYEYERATFNRVRARLGGTAGRDALRQDAYQANARARAAIGRVTILGGDETLGRRLDAVRQEVGGLRDVGGAPPPKNSDEQELTLRHDRLVGSMEQALESARSDFTRPHWRRRRRPTA